MISKKSFTAAFVILGLSASPAMAQHNGETDQVDISATAISNYLEDVVDSKSFENPDQETLARFSNVLQDAKNKKSKETTATFLSLGSLVGIFGGGIVLSIGASINSKAALIGGGTSMVAGLGAGIAAGFVKPSDQELYNLIAKYNQLQPKRNLVIGSDIDRIRNLRSSTALNNNASTRLSQQNSDWWAERF